MNQQAFPQSCVPSTVPPCGTTRAVRSSAGATDSITIEIEQPDTTDYFLAYDIVTGGKIAQLRVSCASGTGKCTLLINQVEVEGIIEVGIGIARAQYTAEGENQFAPGDDIIIRIDEQANLLDLKVTLVIGETSSFRNVQVCDLPGKFIKGEIPIVGDLVGVGGMHINITPQLKKKPYYIFPSYFEKGGPDEDDLWETSVFNIAEDGWIVFFNGNTVENQILHYAYIV